VRAQGTLVRVLLSDATAAPEWSLARSVVDHLGVHVEIDEDEAAPAGSLDILADLGLSGTDKAEHLDDLGINLKPARALGFRTIKVVEPAEALAELSQLVGFPLDGDPR
jgi:putative tRNA adenosine deaminase-associated protein